MEVEEDEVMEAIIELEYKNKARSCDNMTDTIFKKNTYLRIKLKGITFEEEEMERKK